ncbi:unnamed protein product [Camellia sinensis]
MAPGPGYTCGQLEDTDPTVSSVIGGRRQEQVFRTWKSSCTYSSYLANKAPVCCVSYSTFYNPIITSCPHKGNPVTQSDLASKPDIVQCTDHMCPLRVHWHLKNNYKDQWRVKLTISNYNYGKSYSDWNVVVQHPGFSQSAITYSFNSTVLPTVGITEKLDDKATPCIFIGYGDEEFGYRLWDPKHKKVIRSRDVVFQEGQTFEDFGQPAKPKVDDVSEIIPNPAPSQDATDEEELPQHAVNNVELQDGFLEEEDPEAEGVEQGEPQPPLPETVGPQLRRSTREFKPSTKYPASEYILLTDEGEPESFQEAQNHKEKSSWQQSMQEEMQSLQKNQTYDLVKLPQGRKALQNKWVFKLKKDGSGKLVKYKARLVVKGFGQKKDEVALFWGLEHYNSQLLTADEKQPGSVTTEVLLEKDSKSFTLRNGWAFPKRIYFNGDNCEMPLPDTFPMLPNGSLSQKPTHHHFILLFLIILTLKTLLV